MNIFIILPNQLFENNYKFLKGFNKVFIIEEPHYFSSATIKPNKIKVAYLRACMKYYYDDIKKNGVNCFYINFDEISDFYKKMNVFSKTTSNQIMIYEITDFKLEKKFDDFGLKITKVETPMFIMKKTDLDEYNRKTPTHASFYEMSKKKLGLLEGVKNQDIYNRSNPRTAVEFNSSLSYISPKTADYYKEAIQYANKSSFADNYGYAPTLEALKIYPITSEDAYKAFHYFLATNLKNFGMYQDVIQDTNPFMYHSIISPMCNNGLLQPLRLVEIIKDYNKNHKIDISAFEGFVRQLIGWREYMRYLYLYKYDELTKSNNHNNHKSIDKSWYNATTGISIIDNEIKKALTYGYSHHIIRLMVFLNFLILAEVKPEDIYHWFMSIVSIDAYDWVMISNIYSMGYFSKLGMKRPYLSSSNYLLKMSNYKKDGKWDVLWNEKFRSFVKSRKINFYLRSIK
jgi:deoxyribodipyrimidine photolyase-related protein